MIVRWMRGVHLKSRMANADLNSRLGIAHITDVVRRSRAMWLDHERDSDYWISASRSFEINGVEDRVRC